MRDKIFWGVSTIASLYTGIGFVCAAGWPPKIGDNWPLLLLFIIFFLVPFSKKLDIFQFLSFEAKVQEVKQKVDATNERVKEAGDRVRDLQLDIRHVLVQQHSLNTSVNSNIQIHNYPTPDNLAAASNQVGNVTPTPTISARAAMVENDDTVVATGEVAKAAAPQIAPDEQLVILRMKMERELRRLLRRDLEVRAERRGVKYLQSSRMVDMVLDRFPDLANFEEGFEAFFQVANATAHGAKVPRADVNQAIFIGERLMTELLHHNPT